MCLRKKNLEAALKEVWKALTDAVAHYQEQDKRIDFQNDFDQFSQKFKELYASTKRQYMKYQVKELDRHKVVATMIVACIEGEIINYPDESFTELFMAPHMIALDVGLNWMLVELNEDLAHVGENPVKEYTMPDAFACPTFYFDIFSRNLYYAEEAGKLFILDIAEKLFLLEYITLLCNKIDPKVLKYRK